MKIKKWVEFSEEVEISIDYTDVRAAITEAFSRITPDPDEQHPCRFDVINSFNNIGTFFAAITDEQILLMLPGQRKVIADFLGRQAERIARLEEKGDTPHD
jgi:hypothetical protein